MLAVRPQHVVGLPAALQRPVDLSIYLFIYLSIYIHTDIYIIIRICVSLSLYIYIYTCIHVYMYTYIHIYICIVNPLEEAPDRDLHMDIDRCTIVFSMLYHIIS